MKHFTADEWIKHTICTPYGCAINETYSKQENSSRLQLEFEKYGCSSIHEYAELMNKKLESYEPIEIIKWAISTFGSETVMSSSFGIHSALMLDLVTSVEKNIPIIWIDTGYLPKETYLFAASLQDTLNLNIKTFQSLYSPAHMEAMFGKLWENPSTTAHQEYGYIRKVEPMKRALKELNASVMLVGLRSSQTSHRKNNMKIVNVHNGCLKVCPILNWTKNDVEQYINSKKLPFHPLKDQGYETVGDAHSSSPVQNNMISERLTRFHGRSEECGLHIDLPEDEILNKYFKKNDNQQEIEILSSDSPNVIIYTKPKCRFCIASKEIFNERKWKYKEITVGKDITIQDLCKQIGKVVRTVPQIFLNDVYVGGYEDLCHFLDIVQTEI